MFIDDWLAYLVTALIGVSSVLATLCYLWWKEKRQLMSSLAFHADALHAETHQETAFPREITALVHAYNRPSRWYHEVKNHPLANLTRSSGYITGIGSYLGLLMEFDLAAMRERHLIRRIRWLPHIPSDHPDYHPIGPSSDPVEE